MPPSSINVEAALLRDGIAELADRLRTSQVREPELSEAADWLSRLARHPRSHVRRAVANASEYLRHRAFDEIAAMLLEDASPTVAKAAQEAYERRRAISKTQLLGEDHRSVLKELLDSVEAKFGAEARSAALDVSERYADMMMSAYQHEVGRVLTALRMSLRRVADAVARGDDEMPPSALERACERGEFLANLAARMRHLTEVRDVPFKKESLRAMVEEAWGLVVETCPQPPEMTLAIPVSLTIEARKLSLLMAFGNILQNGVEAFDGKPGPIELAVRARRVGRDKVEILFVDRGTGMPEEVLRDAFVLFATSKRAGTGIGLALARRVIESEHRGTIDLQSKVGNGTIVRVVLPLRERKDAAEAPDG